MLAMFQYFFFKLKKLTQSAVSGKARLVSSPVSNGKRLKMNFRASAVKEK